MKVHEIRSLEPYEKDHVMIIVERPRTSYVVAFDDYGRCLMVYHSRRKGWEMPGGKVEPDETSAEAAVRECKEESGYDVEIVAQQDIGYCDVCAARIIARSSDGEMEHRLFDEVPEVLSFSRDEYDMVVPWAKNIVSRS